MNIRQPAVSGMFYEATHGALKEKVVGCFVGPGGPGRLPEVSVRGARNIVGLVCPHAGFIYSGPTSAHGYYRLAEDGLPQVAVILGPSHRPIRTAVAISDDDAWHTPLGDVPVDRDLAHKLATACSFCALDSAAHRLEHSIEVQLPFLQLLIAMGQVEMSIVPILIGVSVMDYDVHDVVRELGHAVAKVVNGRDVVVIASTDFSHYETQQIAEKQDSLAIQQILRLDADELLTTVRARNISMCGVVPTAACIVACRDLGASEAHTLNYRTSGDVTKDYSQVVGYASIELTK